MIYVVWSPEDAEFKVSRCMWVLQYMEGLLILLQSKMIYAHARGTLRRCLDGISREIEATEFSELSCDVVLGRMPTK